MAAAWKRSSASAGWMMGREVRGLMRRGGVGADGPGGIDSAVEVDGVVGVVDMLAASDVSVSMWVVDSSILMGGVDFSVLMGGVDISEGDDLSVGAEILFDDLVEDLVLDLVRLIVAAAGDGRNMEVRRKSFLPQRRIWRTNCARQAFQKQ